MSNYDLIVIGAGPAGVTAALHACELGVRTLIIDEQPAAGGQIHRTVWAESPHASADLGDQLRQKLAESAVVCAFGRRVWTVEPGFCVASLGEEGPALDHAPALVLATGAHERVLPVEGWTLPGVLGLAAATVLVKSHGVVPGRRTLVAGAGPLLPLVSQAILACGGKVIAIADMNARRAWFSSPLDLLSRPDLLARGSLWMARLASAGIPYYAQHALVSVGGRDRVASATIVPIDAEGSRIEGASARTFECDAVCYGHGLLPNLEAAKLLGAALRYSPVSECWAVECHQDQATNIRGLYVCGDGATVVGAAAAPLTGRIAALGVAAQLGRVSQAEAQRQMRPLRRSLRRATRFGKAMSRLCAPKAKESALISPTSIVCRCEAVTRSSVDVAIANGAHTLRAIKNVTRCGMGPCGGRFCGDAIAGLIAASTGVSRSSVAPHTARPPLRPIPVGTLIGPGSYEDLQISEHAPW